jgi:dephospho-CoA kinase
MTSSPTSATSSLVAEYAPPSVAFCGKAGAGKTTAAELLTELGYERYSHAGPLKIVAEVLWPSAVTRERLQRLGRAIRAIHEDTFVDSLLETVGPHGCVVDDMRFPNEYWALVGSGFVVVRITAPLHTRIDRLKGNGRYENDAQLEDESETALDGLWCEHTIENTGTKGELATALVDILAKELKRS